VEKPDLTVLSASRRLTIDRFTARSVNIASSIIKACHTTAPLMCIAQNEDKKHNRKILDGQRDGYPFNGVLFTTTWVRWHQDGKLTILDFNETRDDGVAGTYSNNLHLIPETDNHTSTSISTCQML